MGDGGEVGFDPFQVADGIQQEAAGVDLPAAVLQARELALGGGALQLAKALLLLVPVHSFETPLCAYAAIGIGPL